MKNREALRREFDEIDAEIIALLERRLQVSGEMGELKRQLDLTIYDPSRESQVLEHLKIHLKDQRLLPLIKRIYTCIFEASKEVQKKSKEV